MAWQIVGHDWAVTQLRQSLANDRVAHAYLFCGPPQIGKTRLAVTLAQALNCTQPDPPCGQCAACLKIARQTHPDVQLVAGQGAGESIKIDQVRALQREAALLPYEGRRRVFVLCLFDRATVEAANSLLKTLEEPPAHVVLVLTAVHAEALPSTVVSRCQRLDLRPTTLDIVQSALQERGFPADQARLVARLSGGRMGWALDACTDQGILRHREQDLDQLSDLLVADRVNRFGFAEKASRDAPACRRQVESWIGWWRDLLLLLSQSEENIVNADRLDELRSLVGSATESEVWTMLNALRTTAIQLEANVNTRLALESLMLKLPRWQPVPHRRPASGLASAEQ